MKLLKPLLASALLALPAAPMTVRAEDSDAQKQAIEVLRRVQDSRSGKPAPKATAAPSKAAAAPAKPAPMVAKPAPAPKPVEVKKPAAVAVSAPVANPAYVPSGDSPAQKQALEALRAQQAAKPVPIVVSAPKPMAQPKPKPAPAPAAKPVEMKKAAPVVVSAPKPPAPKPAVAASTPKPAATVAAPKSVAKPAAPTQVSKAAPAPIPAMAPTTKEGKLAELTRRYLNDEVTPREYHTQRAKILAD